MWPIKNFLFLAFLSFIYHLWEFSVDGWTFFGKIRFLLQYVKIKIGLAPDGGQSAWKAYCSAQSWAPGHPNILIQIINDIRVWTQSTRYWLIYHWGCHFEAPPNWINVHRSRLNMYQISCHWHFVWEFQQWPATTLLVASLRNSSVRFCISIYHWKSSYFSPF